MDTSIDPIHASSSDAIEHIARLLIEQAEDIVSGQEFDAHTL